MLIQELDAYMCSGDHYQLERHKELKLKLNGLVKVAEEIQIRTANLQDDFNCSPYRASLVMYIIISLKKQ